MPISNSRKRQFALMITTVVMTLLITVVLAELLIGFLSPQRSMYPRREFSEDYGFVNFASRKTVHEMRGRWRYEYTTNAHRNRGELVPIAETYDVPNIVVLGDSNSFGYGVADGEEYPAVIDELLSGRFNVVNLAVGGWGLTQHIRRYYEFGAKLKPKVVILQFAHNDLDDNFANRVTVIENGEFRFVRAESAVNLVNKYLADSILQKSQIYNLLRDSLYPLVARLRSQRKNASAGADRQSQMRAQKVKFHNELLELFVRELNADGARVLVIAEGWKRAPEVHQKVLELQSEEFLEHVSTEKILAGMTKFASPEGHKWGTAAHRAIGNELAGIVLDANSRGD